MARRINGKHWVAGLVLLIIGGLATVGWWAGGGEAEAFFRRREQAEARAGQPAQSAAEQAVRCPRRTRRILHVRIRRPFGPGARLRHSFDAPPPDNPGVYPEPASGWGFDKESREMLGDYHWGDVHHVALSETDGMYDGRWLFANNNTNNRVARINLSTFRTEQILGPLPNVMGTHCAAFITPNSEYLFMPTRFATTVPVGTYEPLESYSETFWGYMSAISIDPDSGEMDLAWQLKLPPWFYDLSDAGKKVSDGWAFLTTYNTEEATRRLELSASRKDRDYLVIFNWRAAEQAVAEGKYTVIDGAKVVDPAEVPGIVY